MNEIIRHTEYLASRHECVIIPGIGGVLAACVSARYDAEAKMFLPPGRAYSFNAELKMNDGLLTQSVARAGCISYAAASKIVQQETEALMGQLKALGEVPLGRLGVLRYADGAIEFTPFPTDRLSVATSWLRPVAAADVKQQARRAAAVAEPVVLKPAPWRRALRAAASLALLVGIGFVASTPIAAPEGMSYARLAPTVTAPAADPAPMPAPQITVPDPAPLVMVKSSGSDLWIDAPEVAPQTRMDGKYCVVVSSHVSASEASRFIAKHSSESMGVLEKDGRFRVYAATAPSMAEAEQARARIAEAYPQAWVCRR